MRRLELFAWPMRTILGALVVMLLMYGNAAGQSGTAAVRGTVLDPQGNVVAGASITLSDATRNFSRTQTTNADGGYNFTLLPPGVYRIEVEATGFKKSVVNNVEAKVDTAAEKDISLEVGAITETVNVTAGGEAALNTSDATLGNTFESRRIEELPLNARNIVGLLSLQPGVTRAGEVTGSRRDQANITLDGVDVNEQQSGLDIVTGDAFGSVLRVTPDSVQEFRVTTSVPNADQGRSSGGQVSLITKSGSNDFHGSLFEYHRNTVTTANDFFNNAAGQFVATDAQVLNGTAQVGDERVPRPKLIRNIYGGSIGGPIKRDRAFFFYTFEGRRDAAEQSVLRTVPTASLREGNVTYVTSSTTLGFGCATASNPSRRCITLTPANIATLYPATGGVNQAGLALLRTAPLPNDFTTGDGLNVAGFRFNAPISTELASHIMKLDFTLTDKQALYLRGNYQNDLYGRAPQFPDTPSPSLWVNPKGFVVGHVWNVSNTVVNNVRVGLTRQAFTQGGDADANSVNFRFVYQPFLYQRALSRTTPVWNITDDVSWIKNTHSVQFGTNIRFIRNNRETFANSFDTAIVNPSFYANSGSTLNNPIPALDPGFVFDARAAVASVLGRYSQYSFNVNYDLDGDLLPVGAPSVRTFATEEYEFYGLDSWRIKPNLTITGGLRWGYNTPVYETEGFQVTPDVSLGEFFQRRVAGAESGRPVNDLITLDLAGPVNDRPGFYDKDLNNFAPSIAVAWSPDFGDNWFGRLVGREGRSVVRGGFRMVYDRIGSALAVSFDLNNALGFASSATLSANTINTTTRLGPLFTGLDQNFRGGTFTNFLPVPGPITFPLSHPADEAQRIEQTLDDTLTTPTQYTWNASYGRELPKGFSVEASYVGRMGRDLMIVRDIMHLNNLKDPTSGQTWYDAAAVFADLRARNIPFDSSQVPRIPFFENLFPGNSIINAYIANFGFDPTDFIGGLTPSQMAYSLASDDFFAIADYTFLQAVLDDFSPVIGPNAFFHPQYAAFQTLSTIGSADYHGGTLTVRHRFKSDIFFDFNYTFSKSIDNGSPLESVAVLANVTRNPLNLDLSRSFSDFDIRHNITSNWLVALPFGRDKRWLNNAPGVVDALLGGWQTTGIFRYHTGLPAGTPFDVGFWATNWQLTSFGTSLRPVEILQGDVEGRPNIFANPTEAYRSFRNALAGEAGQRNLFRIPSYFTLDIGLSKSFKMPYAENHKLQFRAEVFNITNTQRHGTIANFSLNQDPFKGGTPATDFGRYSGSQTPIGETRPGRVMQFALRYTF
ncbi:MAG TPA: carboxypeptidase-like regulatory domain-containing protein [Pyrinomonadaceae bacterium]|nr:carboxypeptidase-like regulatory domain-containing protein [Pyrinomonadaceae bacterium]